MNAQILFIGSAPGHTGCNNNSKVNYVELYRGRSKNMLCLFGVKRFIEYRHVSFILL